MKLVWMLAQISTPNQTRSIPSLSATGASSGMMMKAISKKSRKNATTKMKSVAARLQPRLPGGSVASCGSRSCSPPFPAVSWAFSSSRADQDIDHHRREAHGARHSLIEELPGARAVGCGERDGADHPLGARFG